MGWVQVLTRKATRLSLCSCTGLGLCLTASETLQPLTTSYAEPAGGRSVYLRWSAAQRMQQVIQSMPQYGIVELSTVILAVYVQAEYSGVPESAERFFLNLHYCC